MKALSALRILTIISLLLVCGHSDAKPLTLIDICNAYKKERVIDGRRITYLERKPDISENLRKVSWTSDHEVPFGRARKKLTVWRTISGVTVNDQFGMENMFFYLYPNNFANLVQRGLLSSTKTPQQIADNMLKAATESFQAQFYKQLVTYSQHMGYDVNTSDDLEKKSRFTKLDKTASIDFGGKKFQPSKTLTVFHVSPNKESPQAKPFVVLMNIETIQNSIKGFNAMAVFSCEFLSEKGVSLAATVTEVDKPIDL